MPTVPRALVDRTRIRAALQVAERSLAPDVVRIMYSFADDVQGNLALFFRVLISDESAAPARLRETTQRIVETVLQQIEVDEPGLQTYFNFRTPSEQASLREPSWEL